jgi:hypothetical protein
MRATRPSAVPAKAKSDIGYSTPSSLGVVLLGQHVHGLQDAQTGVAVPCLEVGRKVVEQLADLPVLHAHDAGRSAGAWICLLHLRKQQLLLVREVTQGCLSVLGSRAIGRRPGAGGNRRLARGEQLLVAASSGSVLAQRHQGLASLHIASHDAAHRRQVYAEVIGDFAIGVGSSGVSRHNCGVSSCRLLRELRQSRRQRTALRLREGQPVAFNAHFALHPGEERFVPQIRPPGHTVQK